MATAKKTIKPKATPKRETGATKKTAAAKAPSRSVKQPPAAAKPKAAPAKPKAAAPAKPKAKAKAAPAKAPVKKPPAKKTPVKKAPVKTAPVKKTPAKAPPAKAVPAKAAPAKKTPPAKPVKKTAPPAAVPTPTPIKKPVNTIPAPKPSPTPAKAASSASPKKPRFSKSDLDHFKNDLLVMRDRIIGQAGSMRDAALQHDDGMNPEEDGTDAFMRLQTLEQVGSQQREIVTIDEALRSIEQGTYGACEMCGELISKPRLTVLPFATTCIKCQSEMERPHRLGGRR